MGQTASKGSKKIVTGTVPKQDADCTPKITPPAAPRIVAKEELLPDGTLLLSFTMPGQPATKKTSQRIVRRRILPSKQYCDYEARMEAPCKAVWIDKGKQPIDCGVSCHMTVYLKSWQVGDATGYMQSVADIMQKWGILANDSWLHWDCNDTHWFAGVDKDNPRIEIKLTRQRHPKEAFRAAQEEAEKKRREKRSLTASIPTGDKK